MRVQLKNTSWPIGWDKIRPCSSIHQAVKPVKTQNASHARFSDPYPAAQRGFGVVLTPPGSRRSDRPAWMTFWALTDLTALWSGEQNLILSHPIGHCPHPLTHRHTESRRATGQRTCVGPSVGDGAKHGDFAESGAARGGRRAAVAATLEKPPPGPMQGRPGPRGRAIVYPFEWWAFGVAQ